jgi:type I restriction enzyme M protein
MLLDRDLLDCIVALPKNLFYGTDITTYLWILDNKRPAERSGKVLFINAAYAEYTRLLQKNLGKKRFEISDEGAADILSLYRDYQNATRNIVYDKTGEVECLEIARLLDYDDFRYTNVATRRPLRHWFESITEKYRALCNTEGFDANAKKNAILRDVASIDGIDVRRSDSDFFACLKSHGVKFTAADIKALRSAFAVVSEDAPSVHEKPLDRTSDLVANKALNDTEKIPQKQDADDYFAREVLPFAPDAWMDHSDDKLGVEFPFTRLFYKYRPLRTADDILAELNSLDDSITL